MCASLTCKASLVFDLVLRFSAEVNISSYPATDVAGLFFFVVQKY